MKLTEYLEDNIFNLIAFILLELFVAFFLWIIDVESIFIAFITLIIFLFFITMFMYDFKIRYEYYNQMFNLLDSLNEKTLFSETLDSPKFLDGKILVELLKNINKYQNDELADARLQNKEYREYIESWVHEIKTPITSARLIVENEKNDLTLRIDDELRKINIYVEQVLYYARSTNVEKDFIVERTLIQNLVNKGIVTYSKQIIQVGGKVSFKNLDYTVLADSKSCSFVIGQIISNAIKYRNENLEIKFSAQRHKDFITLVISDNGLGISDEDIPYIFNKGFTGTVGRRYSKSTGIGLYLSKKICDKMNIKLFARSKLGEGTSIIMQFPVESMVQEVFR
ncbi:TPA: sensor histidine kinase [Streptococcus pyogenes]|nr:sensor histidine kinase [Streptococcus pyogenes]